MVRVNLSTYFKTAQSLHQSGKFGEARKLYQEILKLSPTHLESRFMLAQTFYENGNYEKAIQHYNEGLKLKPEGLNLLIQLAASYVKLNQPKEAIRILEEGIEKTGNPQLKLNLGIVKNQAGLPEEAIDIFESFGLNSIDSDKALFYCARSFQQVNKIKESISAYRKCLSLNPKHRGTLNNLANIYQKVDEQQKAVSLYKNLISHYPEEVMGYNNLAGLYEKLNETDKSIQLYQKAIALDSTLGIAWYNLVYLFSSKDKENALSLCSKGLKTATGPFKEGLRYLQILLRQKLNQWTEYDKDQKDLHGIIKKYLNDPNPVFEILPFDLTFLKVDHLDYKKVAEKQAQRIVLRSVSQSPAVSYSHSLNEGKIKIGYYSPQFRQHPGGYLVRKIFDFHNNSDFEIHAFSLKHTDDKTNKEIQESVDYYHDVSELPTLEIANLINRTGVDILVALAGYNEHMNMEVLALRPAPVQMLMIGSHQTTGAPFIDYVLSDEFMMDKVLRSFFSENMITLPISILLNSELPHSIVPPTNRSFHELPSSNFVFASFNHPQKIDPEVFDCWIEILKNTSNSVLWLYDGGSETSRKSLMAYAEKRSLSPDRIIFAKPIEIEKHWERMKHADLFLDTFVCNAHFTALEALRIGKPILTRRGNNHNSRLCSSLLHYAGLDSLITESSKSYIDRAIQIYNNKSELTDMSEKLSSQDNIPLFDTQLQVKFLEKAFKLVLVHFKKTGQYKDFIVKSSLKFDAFH